MKIRHQECRYCRTITKHRIRKVSRKPHSKDHRGGLKYIVEHCTRCNKKWYNGKIKEEKRKKHITI